MIIKEVFTKNVVTARPDETLYDAAKKMWVQNVGAIVVVDKENVPVGIITDRDISMKGVAQGKDPKTTSLKTIMSQEVVVLNEERTLFEAARTMREQGIRRIPVVNEKGTLSGIISLDDMLTVFGREMSALAGTVAYGTLSPAGKKLAVKG